jgi:uncharacterized protein
MPAYTYPGVFIQELPSGQHAIAGVATSIAAFIGWSSQGPVGKAIMVKSWAEYETLFGGMISGVPLGYSVNQFFLNGGTQAYIVRLYDNAGTATSAKWASNTIGGLTLYASNPGRWANAICIGVSNLNPAPGGHASFDLQVFSLTPSGLPAESESYANLSSDPANPRWAVAVVDAESTRIRFTPPDGAEPVSLPTPFVTPEVWIAAGALTSSAIFASGETVTQAGSGATATVLGTINGAYMILSASPSGTTSNTGVWTGSNSHATFAAATAPAPLSATPLALDGSPGAGADGRTLAPNQDPFEAQLMNVSDSTPPTGYALLSDVPVFNLLCVPGENSAAVVSALQQFCSENRAFLIIDAAPNAAPSGPAPPGLGGGPADWNGVSLSGPNAGNSAFYFPWVSAPDPLANGSPTLFPPCGFVAGIYASTDASRGVFKAPAGVGARLNGALGLQYVLTDAQNGALYPLGVNCLRQFPNLGMVVWGARTVAGADALGSQWKYVPIRRLALYIESSLYAGLGWVVFEPNREPLWGEIRRSVGAFLQGLFLQGAFSGSTPEQAYFVKCDGENNTGATTALGVLNIAVGFAPLYPAEFEILQIQQMMSCS